MTGRELGTSLLIGVLSGAVVTVVAWALSGSPMPGIGEAAITERAPLSSGGGASNPPIAARSPEDTAVPSPAATAVQTAEPTTVRSPEPTTVPSAEPTSEPTAVPTFGQPGVKVGLPADEAAYGLTTPVAPTGRYITWRADVGPDGAGRRIDVEVATRLGGTWTGWSSLTTRVADPEGTAVFSWRQQTPAWISVRFALESNHSIALQGRWR